jgi:hypothetical protein
MITRAIKRVETRNVVVPTQQHTRIIAAVAVKVDLPCGTLSCAAWSATRVPTVGLAIGKLWFGQ